MIPLKNDYCYAILDERGMAVPGGLRAAGIYRHDTRHLSRYAWDFGDLVLLHQEASGRTLTQFWSRMQRHAQHVLLRRELRLEPDALIDALRIENSLEVPTSVSLALEADADFADVFEARGHRRRTPKQPVERDGDTWRYEAVDGAVSVTRIDRGGLQGSEVSLPPQGSIEIEVRTQFLTGGAPPSYPLGRWTPALEPAGPDKEREVLAQAVADLDALLLGSEHGPILAAGIPNFVVPFGRDSLISAWFLLEVDPGLARAVLRYLAARQGTKIDPFRDEEPGKIMHEHREGELSRIGDLPFRTYYGSADSTPLFVMVLADYVAKTGDAALAVELERNWRAAMRWIESYADEHGLIRFRRRADGKGLTVQSWKDSADSMSYGDGEPAKGNLAVAEVQGYVFAALHAAAALSSLCRGPEAERRAWLAEAAILRARVDELFWMPQHDNYAMALDGDGRQLDVDASDSGHLLWSGIVPEDKAPVVIARLFADDLWSGYGLRTLSTREKRYNPLSYHNGSVWPHDTAIFGAGLRRYGDDAGFARVKEALIALAERSADKRLPELVGGYARGGDIPPLPYLESCRPQAWAAAALIYVCSVG